MIQQTELIGVSDARGTVARLVRQESVPQELVEAAQDTLTTMLRLGAEQGLTTAEVVTAVLKPVIENKPGCDCPTCKARRAARTGGPLVSDDLGARTDPIPS